jgi:DNA-directed RNA polymerase specialized sigma24 family protein
VVLVTVNLWELAKQTLTQKELYAYELRHRHQLSLRQISLALGVSLSTTRDRLDNADRKMAAALRDADGNAA